MKAGINDTHDPALKSWVVSANSPDADFPIQNLPFGIFRRKGSAEAPRAGTAIGDEILDLAACASAGLLTGPAAEAAATSAEAFLNHLMALGRGPVSALRRRLSELLREGNTEIPPYPNRLQNLLLPAADAEMLLPAGIGDYSDFYASIYHATTVGKMFRPDNPLLPNYKHIPIGYHGRASSIVVDGTPIRRPWGQSQAAAASGPDFGPSRVLDYEVEAGFFVGPGNVWGEPITMAQAEDRIFGFCLLNDWSARDIQRWEYQPLGPFLAKSFATSISPWVVTLEALEPFRVPAFPRPEGDPAPLAYLDSPGNRERGGFDLRLELFLSTAKMREQGLAPKRLSQGSTQDLYWTPAQMLTHHASNGCNLRPGDLLGSGTVSGPDPGSQGCLLELTREGPITLPGGEQRRFLEDGDEVILRGYCQAEGFARIGLGECTGRILPANAGKAGKGQ